MPEEVTCIMCPLGCSVEVQIDGQEVSVKKGCRCKEGMKFVKMEAIFPGRILTTTMRTDSSDFPLLPVRSNKEISKEKLLDCVRKISQQNISIPVVLGQTVVENILGSGVDIIACRSIPGS
jgi:CxxC motif-containing protein